MRARPAGRSTRYLCPRPPVSVFFPVQREPPQSRTHAQGKEAVKAFADVMLKMFDAMEGVRDPQRMARKLVDYANGKDPVFDQLKARVEAAGDNDNGAEFDLQQHILNNELGDRKLLAALSVRVCVYGELNTSDGWRAQGPRHATWIDSDRRADPRPIHTQHAIRHTTVVDLKELGFDGTEPAILQLARGAVKKEEPAIWDSVLSDPLARKYMVRSDTAWVR